MKQNEKAYFGEIRDVRKTNEYILRKKKNTHTKKQKPVHQTIENISPTKQLQGTAHALPSNIDAQLLQQTSYNSPQGQKHKESRYHRLFLLSVLYYQFNTII